MPFRAEAIIPQAALADPAAIGATLVRVLDEAAAEVVKALEGTTATWQHKPAFSIESPTPSNRNVFTRDQIYQWVNDGTPPHEILPVRARALAFMTGGASKSTPGSLAAGPGTAGGETVVRRGVHHPGVAARQFDLLIASEWQDGKFQQRLQAALNEL